MTTAVAVICVDGIVIGSDKKVTAGSVKWVADKLLTQGQLSGQPLIVAGAGGLRHVADAVGWLQINDLDKALPGNATFNDFLAKVLEVALPRFVQDYQEKYLAKPEAELLIATVDKDGTPHLVQTYDDGEYDISDQFSAIGSGSIFGEILLRRLYHRDITTEVAQRLVGYIIWEIQTVDNDSGEDMQIVTIRKDGSASFIAPSEIKAYMYFPELVSPSYDGLRQQLEAADIQPLITEIGRLQDILNEMKQQSTVAKGEGANGEANPRTTRQDRRKKAPSSD